MSSYQVKALSAADLFYASVMASIDGDEEAAKYLWECGKRVELGDLPSKDRETAT